MMEKTTNNKGWSTKGALSRVDMYKVYCTMVKDPVDYKSYTKIILACNNEMMRMIVEDGKEVRMPYLNMLKVRKIKTNVRTGIDYGHFKKTGEVKQYDNTITDGYVGRMHWSKSKAIVVGKSTYSFRPNRDWARAITTEIRKPNGHAKYIEHGN